MPTYLPTIRFVFCLGMGWAYCSILFHIIKIKLDKEKKKKKKKKKRKRRGRVGGSVFGVDGGVWEGGGGGVG